MKSYRCNKCSHEFNVDNSVEIKICKKCLSYNIKRIWPTAININGHGYKNNFEGNKK